MGKYAKLWVRVLKKILFKNQHFLLLFILISIAFIRNFECIKGLNYGYDLDSDRDVGNVQNVLEGNFTNDPSYLGEYIWYNPLITYLEVAIIKLTGISPVLVATRSGAFLNILCVLLFYLMVKYLFNSKIAIVATASFLFFSTGNMPSWGSATYAPWLYPVNLMQGIFYLGIIFVCKAFVKPGNFPFLLAGFITGIAFLGHAAPAIILLLIIIYLFLKKFRYLLKAKSNLMTIQFLKYGTLFNIAFLITSLPFLIFIVGKYKLHMINPSPSEYMHPLFDVRNFPQLIKENFSFSFLISLAGLYFLYFSRYKKNITSDVLLAWFFTTVLLYAYTSFIPLARHFLGLTLPGIVPSFHFFFYLKALQSVLFGIGLCSICDILYVKIFKHKENPLTLINDVTSTYVTCLILIVSLLYYPIYNQRIDFYEQRQYALKRNSSTDEIEIYHWLLNNTNINDVVACDYNLSGFPVMASGRKLVAAIHTFSNPYVNYSIRENDRKLILNLILAGDIIYANELLNKYKVRFIVLENNTMANRKKIENNLGEAVFINKRFNIYKYNPVNN